MSTYTVNSLDKFSARYFIRTEIMRELHNYGRVSDEVKKLIFAIPRFTQLTQRFLVLPTILKTLLSFESFMETSTYADYCRKMIYCDAMYKHVMCMDIILPSTLRYRELVKLSKKLIICCYNLGLYDFALRIWKKLQDIIVFEQCDEFDIDYITNMMIRIYLSRGLQLTYEMRKKYAYCDQPRYLTDTVNKYDIFPDDDIDIRDDIAEDDARIDMILMICLSKCYCLIHF